MNPPDNRICIIDASPSGVSGDKYLGALIDLGGNPKTLSKVAKVVAESLPGTRSIEVKIRKVERGEIGARLVTIESNKTLDKRKGSAILSSAKKCVSKLGLSEWGSSFALNTVRTLLDAESKVHGYSKEQVELH